MKVWSKVRSLLHTLTVTCETKQPGALVKDVRKLPPEYSNLNTSMAAQGTCCQHRAAISGTVLVKHGLFTEVSGIYSSASLAASTRIKHALHAKRVG